MLDVGGDLHGFRSLTMSPPRLTLLALRRSSRAVACRILGVYGRFGTAHRHSRTPAGS
jgi:hypothetical protein